MEGECEQSDRDIDMRLSFDDSCSLKIITKSSAFPTFGTRPRLTRSSELVSGISVF